MIVRSFFLTTITLTFFSCSEVKTKEDADPDQQVDAANFEYKPAVKSPEEKSESDAYFFDVAFRQKNDEKVYQFHLSNNDSKYRYVQSADKTMLVPMDMRNKYSGSIVFSGNKTGEFDLTGGYGTPSVIVNVDPSTVGYALKDGKLIIEKYEENGVISGHFSGVAENTNDPAVQVKGTFRIKAK